jgi:hypothetical protein
MQVINLSKTIILDNKMADEQPQYNFSGQDELDKIPDSHFDYLDKLKDQSQNPAPSQLESGLRGIAQGATLNSAPVITGAAQALGDKAQGLLSGQQTPDLADLYRQYQQASQKQYDAAQQANPKTYLAGNIAGSIAPLALAPEAEGGLLAKMGTNALTGATVGGVSALGSSQGNLDTEENRKQLGEDVVKQALTGTALGSAASLAGSALSSLGGKVGQYIENSPLLRQMSKSFNTGAEGVALNGGEASVGAQAGQLQNHVTDLTNRFSQAEEAIGKQIGSTLSNAGDSGVQVSLSPEAATASSALMDYYTSNPLLSAGGAAKKLMQGLHGLMSADGVSPEAASEIRDQLINLAKSPSAPPGLQEVVNDLQGQIRSQLTEAVPGLDDLYKAFYGLRNAGTETILAKGTPTDIAQVWAGSLKNPQNSLYNGVEDLLSKLTSPGSARLEANQTVQNLTENLGKYDQQFPGLLENYGINPDTIGSDIQNKADDFATAQQILRGNISHGHSVKGLALSAGGGLGGLGLRGANIAGRALSPVVNMSKNLYELPESSLRTVAGMLNDGGLNNLGDALNRNLDSGNPTMKNAVLFSIMQNPKARIILGSGQNNENPQVPKYNFSGIDSE